MEANQIKSIKINFQEWSQYLKNKAQRSLLDKDVKAFESENFEPAENLALKYKLKREENLQIPITDQKNEVIGKISVYYMSEKTISAFWCKRVT